jgi:uncharacterized RDD family membrane protein YckC
MNNCQNCDAPVLFADERCRRCGAKLLHRRVFSVAPKVEEFTLTVEDPSIEEESPGPSVDFDFDARGEFAPEPPRVVAPSAPVAEPRWGGFFRRLGAFCLDVAILLLLTALMGIMAFVGYKVGLAAHQRAVSIDNAAPLVLVLTMGWSLLTTGYFVLFHGMDGRTIGKRLLGLRVVGPEQTPITYYQAFLRWLGLVLAVVPLAAGVLWILLSREKRGWHDYLARTWVVRD